MSEDKQAVSVEAGQAEAVQTQPQGQAAKVNLDELPEFRKWKSEQDKRDAARQKELEAERQAREKLESKLEELITDPDAKARYQQERMREKLARFEAMEAAQKSRQLFADRWGVPESIFSIDDSPADMTTKALDYLKQQHDLAVKGKEVNPVEEEVKEIEASGGHVVTTSIPTAPEKQTDLEITNRIKELQEVARTSRGRAAESARLEILRLKEISAKQKAPRAKV